MNNTTLVSLILACVQMPSHQTKSSLSPIFLMIGAHLHTGYPNTYPLESVSSHGCCYPTFEQPGPSQTVSITVVDPDPQTRGRPGYPDPEISGWGGGGLGLAEIFSALQASFWSKNKGGAGPSPESATVIMSFLKGKKCVHSQTCCINCHFLLKSDNVV